jgi:hypothetical protein
MPFRPHLLLAYAAAGGGIAYYLYDSFDKSSGFSQLDPVQQHIYFHSENAFYYSYFHHVVRANSTWDAVRTLVADGRTEFPDVINALERFNVYQEAVLGFVYRFGGAQLGTPMQFYLGAVFALQARALGRFGLDSASECALRSPARWLQGMSIMFLALLATRLLGGFVGGCAAQVRLGVGFGTRLRVCTSARACVRARMQLHADPDAQCFSRRDARGYIPSAPREYGDADALVRAQPFPRPSHPHPPVLSTCHVNLGVNVQGADVRSQWAASDGAGGAAQVGPFHDACCCNDTNGHAHVLALALL